MEAKIGIGDQIIATGIARGAQERGKRIAFGDGSRIAWDHNSRMIFAGNPNIAPPGSEGSADLEWNPFRKGHRVYNHHDRANNRWVWNMAFRCVPGQIFLDRGENAWAGLRAKGAVVVEPNIEAWKSVAPNKQWPVDRYDAVVDQLVRQGVKVVQFVYGTAKAHLCPGATAIQTPSFRHAAALLATAAAYLGAEGGLHHAAAAFDVPAVVLFGGFVPPEVTGYGTHINLTGGAEACGSINRCDHCRDAMDRITVAETSDAIHTVLKGRI